MSACPKLSVYWPLSTVDNASAIKSHVDQLANPNGPFKLNVLRDKLSLRYTNGKLLTTKNKLILMCRSLWGVYCHTGCIIYYRNSFSLSLPLPQSGSAGCYKERKNALTALLLVFFCWMRVGVRISQPPFHFFIVHLLLTSNKKNETWVWVVCLKCDHVFVRNVLLKCQMK